MMHVEVHDIAQNRYEITALDDNMARDWLWAIVMKLKAGQSDGMRPLCYVYSVVKIEDLTEPERT